MHREERGRYLIEASAFHLTDGNKWQPRLTMTRLACANALSKSQSFPGLVVNSYFAPHNHKPTTTNLGRSMADEGSPRLKV